MSARNWCLAFGALLMIVIGFICNFTVPVSELKDKEIWATLQSVEAEHRGKPAKKYIIIRKALGAQYDVLGVPTKSSKAPMAWIPLNEEKEDSPMKILPQGEKINISCVDAKDIMASANPDDKVVRFLRSECVE